MRIFPGFFPKTRKEELTAVFHIGSSFVGGALFLARGSDIPQVIFSVVMPLPVEEKIDAGMLSSSTIKVLYAVAGSLHDAKLGVPKRVFCILSSPWYASEVRTITVKKNTSFVFTEKLADELIQKEVKLFREENLLRYKEENEIRPIELKSVQTTLNGYDAENAIGQKAKELEIVVFISMSGEKMLRKIEGAIQRHFHGSGIKFSSFAMASFTVARDMFAKGDNFLLVDVGGEITEVFMAKKSVLRESVSYPVGRNFLIRGVASRMGTTLDEAASLLSLARDGHAEESVAKKLMPIIAGAGEVWLKKFQESLVNLSKDISVPSKIYLTADRDTAPFFMDMIRREEESQYSLAQSKFEIVFIGPELLYTAVQFKGEAVLEPSLSIDAVYINRFLTKI